MRHDELSPDTTLRNTAPGAMNKKILLPVLAIILLFGLVYGLWYTGEPGGPGPDSPRAPVAVERFMTAALAASPEELGRKWPDAADMAERIADTEQWLMESGQAPLACLLAARGKDARTLRLLIDAGLDVSRADSAGRGPLHHAALHNADPMFLTVLMNHGADPDVKDTDGHTALDLVILHGMEHPSTPIPRYADPEKTYSYHFVRTDLLVRGGDAFHYIFNAVKLTQEAHASGMRFALPTAPGAAAAPLDRGRAINGSWTEQLETGSVWGGLDPEPGTAGALLKASCLRPGSSILMLNLLSRRITSRSLDVSDMDMQALIRKTMCFTAIADQRWQDPDWLDDQIIQLTSWLLPMPEAERDALRAAPQAGDHAKPFLVDMPWGDAADPAFTERLRRCLEAGFGLERTWMNKTALSILIGEQRRFSDALLLFEIAGDFTLLGASPDEALGSLAGCWRGGRYDPEDARHGAALLQKLLDAGADPNQRVAEDHPPLHVAARAARKAELEILLAAGADPNAPGGVYRDKTPLYMALEWSKPHPDTLSCVEALLRAGADPKGPSPHGGTVLEYMREAQEREPENATAAALYKLLAGK